MDKTLQSPSMVLMRSRKDMNNVSCCHDMTEILLKTQFYQFNVVNFFVVNEKKNCFTLTKYLFPFFLFLLTES